MYRIGELARAAGVNPRTVDYYTRIGLLQPESRSDSSYRLYAEGSLQRLKTIQELQAHKYSLDQIRALLDKAPDDAIAEASRLQTELEHMLKTVEELKGSALDSKARYTLTALAVKGMALAQQLMLILNAQEPL